MHLLLIILQQLIGTLTGGNAAPQKELAHRSQEPPRGRDRGDHRAADFSRLGRVSEIPMFYVLSDRPACESVDTSLMDPPPGGPLGRLPR